MEQFEKLLIDSINDKLYQLILSNPKKTSECKKVKIRPVLVKDKLLFQETSYVGTKVLHENYEKEHMVKRILALVSDNFKQGELEHKEFKATILISKKGKVTIKKKQVKEEREISLEHNRNKKYILEEGVPIPFLVSLGVQTKAGKIVRAKYDKFRQINRYLEFIRDVLPILPKERRITIIDFGCGKSYLTFAMYYYLKIMNHMDIFIIGLDLKEDVIEHCSRMAVEYGYEESLQFRKGDISTFTGTERPDMVVTLHACDTATDYALEKAVRWGAKVILSVPCCQHEINKQIECKELEPILKYGLLKERISALFTDGIRANLLEEMGYDTQILEFIDMEHTPKNLLIRAVKREKMSEENENTREFLDFIHAKQTLCDLLAEDREKER